MLAHGENLGVDITSMFDKHVRLHWGEYNKCGEKQDEFVQLGMYMSVCLRKFVCSGASH